MTQRWGLDCIIFGLQRYGGISSYWARLVDALAARADPATTLLLPRETTYADFDPAWTKRLHTQRERGPAALTRYLSARATGAPLSMLHTSYYRLPTRRGARYVVSAYDFTYERYRSGLPRLVHTRQKFASLRRADAVLCISNATRRDALELCPGLDPARLHVTPLGVDSATFFRDATPPDPALASTVLFVGQRGGYKRFDLAVEALRQCPRLELGIVGPPLDAAEHQTLRAALGTRWKSYGPVGTAELRRLYGAARAFVFPSDYEGFGLPVLEAMACGCPVVAADRSSLPEVGGSAARYAAEQSGEAYASQLQALDDAASRSGAAAAGLARAARFSWTRTIERTLAAYAGDDGIDDDKPHHAATPAEPETAR